MQRRWDMLSSVLTCQWNVWLHSRLLTFNLSFDHGQYSYWCLWYRYLLLCSLRLARHYFLVILNIVSCYGRRQLTWVNPPIASRTALRSTIGLMVNQAIEPGWWGSLIYKLVPSFHYVTAILEKIAVGSLLFGLLENRHLIFMQNPCLIVCG